MERYLEIKIASSKPDTIGNLLKSEAGLTKRQISQAKFRPGGIQKNKKQCRVTETAQKGDVLRVCLETKETDSFLLENWENKEQQARSSSDRSSSDQSSSDQSSSNQGSPWKKLEILYEDQDLLVVNKPAGMVTHPSGGHYADSLSNQIAAYFRSKGEETRIRSIGRLDKETSGVLLFARNQVAAARLQKQREEGQLQKTYLAIARGNIDTGDNWYKISLPLAPDRENHLKMTVSPDGKLPGSKTAVTYLKVLASCDEYTVIKVRLETGRTHQIRVHMASIGHPLLGDSLYDMPIPEEAAEEKEKKTKQFRRAALHAWKIRFIHPFTGEKMMFETPLPEDFAVDFTNFI